MEIVRDAMSPGIEVVDAGCKLQMAAQKMADKNIGFLAIGEGSRITGCITDRDMAVKAVARGLDPREHTVEEVMNRNVQTVGRGSRIKDARRLMEEHRIRRLVVVDEEDRPVGVLSLGDLAARSDHKDAGHVYQEIAQDLTQRPA